jgi:hypothetical protein
MMTRDRVVFALIRRKEMNIAAEVLHWRSKTGTAQGWDGWFRGTYPKLYKMFFG